MVFVAIILGPVGVEEKLELGVVDKLEVFAAGFAPVVLAVLKDVGEVDVRPSVGLVPVGLAAMEVGEVENTAKVDVGEVVGAEEVVTSFADEVELRVVLGDAGVLGV